MSDAVAEKLFAAGEVIYAQGEAGQGMLLVLSGTVEVSVATPEGPRVLARFGAGDFLGDMALITNQPRAATARALTAVTAEWIDDRSFEERLLEQPDRRASYLALLMQRIRITDSLLRLEWHKQEAAVQVTRAAYLEALPATASGRSDWLDLRLISAPGTPPPVIDVIIPQVPFSIGRLTFPLPVDALPTRRLSIPDKEPYQLCRDHCEIVRTAEGLVVRDVESRLGTNVNGVQVGRDFATTEAALKPGPNTLTLGGPESHYRFILELAEV
ncbi:cyclic nucleotide-binding domain-containing protein [Prosthecobacter sp.]|uniref:cyclic nucleotide-binding domain-containing protein n=1 Tax=Prosthecobacter sp. TaxID=1965333 RepID=UPI002AB9911A|nr:cyclic nucleotide-binding domain-containing protein [Prosthecobacter sp.]MDZ4403508.1 cyclic nucleotide-binding domain-containing protein [Prosthecobacter sp.]